MKCDSPVVEPVSPCAMIRGRGAVGLVCNLAPVDWSVGVFRVTGFLL